MHCDLQGSQVNHWQRSLLLHDIVQELNKYWFSYWLACKAFQIEELRWFFLSFWVYFGFLCHNLSLVVGLSLITNWFICGLFLWDVVEATVIYSCLNEDFDIVLISLSLSLTLSLSCYQCSSERNVLLIQMFC